MRFAVDVGGTFTDLVVEQSDGRHVVYKSPTVPADPVTGVLDVFEVAARARGVSRRELLAGGTMLVHGTTRAINAVLTQSTARTAFLTTAGHPDTLVLREGGRSDVFDFSSPYPEPYVPRALTFEIPERIDAEGQVITPLDESAVRAILERLRELQVEAVGVCLLWSIANPSHELRLGELLADVLPDVPFTLSHQLNGCLREYRRSSSTVIDASLKPLMQEYLGSLDRRLADAGFAGRLLVVTSNGAVLDANAVAAAPVYSLNSGPAMAPVAGRHFATLDADTDTAIVADTGGTTYDVTVVRRGRIPRTREMWIGDRYLGHLTGFPSIDVKSVGAGGGSIAWIDHGGLLHVGPQSAGADPGPACYGRGGTEATLTDACVVLGLIDPNFFLGGAVRLDHAAAQRHIGERVAVPLGISTEAAAAAIYRLATQRMVSAIEEITIQQGIDPRGAALIGGGGAAGLNSAAIAARLGCRELVIPMVGPALSAAGALLSDLAQDFEQSFATSDVAFDLDGVNQVLDELRRRCSDFIATAGDGAVSTDIEFEFEAHYPHQIWELDVPLHVSRLEPADVADLSESFHRAHEEVFAVADRSSPVEIVRWRARARCRLHSGGGEHAQLPTSGARPIGRRVFLPGTGWADVGVWRLEDLDTRTILVGPAIVESPLTTVLVDIGTYARRHDTGSLVITLGDPPTMAATEPGMVHQ